jgi:hypothetical protein
MSCGNASVHHHIGGLERINGVGVGLGITRPQFLSHLCGGELGVDFAATGATFLSHLCGGERLWSWFFSS